MEHVLYPMKPPARHRDSETQMQVLCLGLSRSGTDSLRAALEILGYKGVYHGFVLTARQREDCAFWVPLMRRKLSRSTRESTNSEVSVVDFDSVLANCEAVTDGPANVFGEELMAFYPDAKVILNRRRDIDAWYASMEKNCLEAFNWPMWILSWFDTRMCWLWWNFDLVMRGYYDNDFKKHGKRVATEHYEALEDKLQSSRRPYLDWSVEQGWCVWNT